MFSYVGRRIVYSIPVLLVSSFILFWAVRVTFDPLLKFRGGGNRDPLAIQRQIERLGLDKSIPRQYWIWINDFFRGDWGVSSRTNGDVFPMIWRALGVTLQMIVIGVVVSALFSVAIGVYSAVRQYSIGDYFFTGFSYLGVAMPPFWFGLIAIQFLAVWPKERFDLDETPFFFIGLHSPGMSGFNMDYLRHLFLPVLTLTVQIVGSWSRYQRAAMLDVLSSDYVRTARAKGIPRNRVIFKHAFRNALGPLVTVISVDAALLMGGLIITEKIFSIPGMGRLFFDSLLAGDVFVLVPWMIVTAAVVIVFNLIADLLYGVIDPRVRVS